MNGAVFSNDDFDIFKLTDLINHLPFPILPSFYEKLALLQQNLAQQCHKPLSFLNDLHDIFTIAWHNVIDINTHDEIAISVSQTYKTLWLYLIDNIAISWANDGEMPISLLPQLLNLIDSYYSGDLNNTKQLFADFIYTIIAIPSPEIRHNFYGQQIEYQGNKHYLLSFLLECLDEHEHLDKRLRALAIWIYDKNHSLIAKSHQLSSLYQERRVGDYFDINALQILIKKLTVKADSLLAKKLQHFKKIVSQADDIGYPLIASIKELYFEHWMEVIDTVDDYTRLIAQKNDAWIQLAQALAGCQCFVNQGWISSNYYKLLIPTLEQDIKSLSDEPLIWYPLNYYILSDDCRELICVSDCIEHHKQHNTFYRPDKMPMTELTLKEKERLQASSSYFKHYFLMSENTQDEPVRKKTIDAVKTMVEASLFYKGLRKGEEYTAQQMLSAYNAYDHFLSYVATLDDSEKNNLYRQRIKITSKCMTFADVMKKIQPQMQAYNSDEHCIASLSKFFLKMVVDYDPDSKFLKELEENIVIDSFRIASDKKVYADYGNITDDEAIKRLQILYVSLMSRTFTFTLGYGNPIFFWDCTNMVTGTCVKLEQKLHHMMNEGDYSQARFLYASILESIIKPALLMSSLTRTTSTRLWFESIVDETLFQANNTIIFEPELLLQVLWQELKKQPERAILLEPFLDQVIHTILQQMPDSLKLLRINIKLSQLLHNLDNHYHNELLTKLRKPASTLVKFTYFSNTTEFILHRLASLVSRKNRIHLFNFFTFDHYTNIDRVYYEQFLKALRQQLTLFPLSEKPLITDLLEYLSAFSATITTKNQHDMIRQYLETITDILPNHEANYYLIAECEF